MPYYFASFHSHSWRRLSNGSTPTKIEILHGITAHCLPSKVLSHRQDQCSTLENFKFLAVARRIYPWGMGTLPRLHIRMSSSWDGKLATHADILPRVDQQYPWDYGSCCWRCFPITHTSSYDNSRGEDGLQPRLEWRMCSDPQEVWRYASTQGGRHAMSLNKNLTHGWTSEWHM